MFERKIFDRLMEWKDSKGKKSLIIEGARQVGKTFIVNEFAKKYYGKDSYIYINFELDQTKKKIFEEDITADSIYMKLSLLFREVIKSKKKILLFLDEIQSCPRAITALKSLTIDSRLDVIASGSLLGVNYKNVSSFPVGYVERLKMFSMDFEEFLWANDVSHTVIEDLKNSYNNDEQVSSIMHYEMMKLFREYIVCGGMPEVVQVYIDTLDFDLVLTAQNRILDDYQSDIAKYASGSEKVKAKECFSSIPNQLGKDNKKFQYKYVSKGGRSSTYEGSIQWLIDAGIVLKCNNITTPKIPLVTHKRVDAYKLYVSDIGLLIAMLGEESQTLILFGDLGISKGAVYENVIANILNQQGYKLYYFEKDSKLEIDFIIIKDSKVTGIEVKSANNTQSKSLSSFLKNHGGEQGIKLSSKNTSVTKNEKRIPLYMAMFL